MQMELKNIFSAGHSQSGWVLHDIDQSTKAKKIKKNCFRHGNGTSLFNIRGTKKMIKKKIDRRLDGWIYLFLAIEIRQ